MFGAMLRRAVPVGGGGSGAARSCLDKRNIPPNEPKHATVYLNCPSSSGAAALLALGVADNMVVPAAGGVDADAAAGAGANAVGTGRCGAGRGAVTGKDRLDTQPNFSQAAGRGAGCACP